MIRLKSKAGMTLIEILVVITIIAFLFTTIFTSVNQRRKKAQVSQAKILIRLVDQSVMEFNHDCGYYPETLTDLVEPVDGCESWGPKPYLKNGKIPKDPWNNEVVYEYYPDTNDYEVISYGADRRAGGDEFSRDLSSKD